MKTNIFILTILSVLFTVFFSCEYESNMEIPMFEQIVVDSSWYIPDDGEYTFIINIKEKIIDTVDINHNPHTYILNFKYLPQEKATIKQRIDTLYKEIIY
jgi:hypothetical protein